MRGRDSPCGRLATSAVAMLAEVFDQKMAIVVVTASNQANKRLSLRSRGFFRAWKIRWRSASAADRRAWSEICWRSWEFLDRLLN